MLGTHTWFSSHLLQVFSYPLNACIVSVLISPGLLEASVILSERHILSARVAFSLLESWAHALVRMG